MTAHTDWLAVVRKAAEDTIAAVDALTAPVEVKVELPTEPGIYTYGPYGDHATLHRNGQWTCNADGSMSWLMSMDDVAAYAPFTKLEPVAETAKKVLAAIEAEFGENYTSNKDEGWNVVARQFGVQS